MGWTVKQQNNKQPTGKWVVKQPVQNQTSGKWVVKSSLNKTTQPPQASKGAWQWVTDQLIKPVSSASNLLEDTGKSIGAGISYLIDPQKTKEKVGGLGIDFIGHQKDVWSGGNKRIYSDILNDIANKQNDPVLSGGIKTVGYGSDFILDPLNKLKILGLTEKGLAAEKVGTKALSLAEQGAKGERSVVQFGKYNLLPKVVNEKVLSGATGLNDALRATKYGGKIANVGSKLSTKIRPGGVTREEFKVITDAKNAAKNTVEYAQSKAIEFAKNIQNTLTNRKATQFERSQLLHAIEKGEERLAPVGFQDVWKQGVDFKLANEELWKKLGGATLEGHGLSHVATKEVADAARKSALKGGKIYSPNTPQDIHREWMKVNGEVTNIKDAGIRYSKKTKEFLKPVDVAPVEKVAKKEGGLIQGQFVKSADRGNYGRVVSVDNKNKTAQIFFKNKSQGTSATIEIPLNKLKPTSAAEAAKNGFSQVKWQPVNVTQASAQEINNALVKQGKNAIFQEDLPVVVAKMGISTGRKQAGVEFLEAIKNIKGEEAKKIAEDTYTKITNVEAINKAIKGFDKIQSIWKAQALVSPAYHIRNMAGNLWNNYLAGVAPTDYAKAAKLQTKIARGTLNEAEKTIVKEMEQNGVIGTGWYGKDIATEVGSEVQKGTLNPFSQRFIGYRANKFIGSGVEDNAKIAHFLSKRSQGYGVKQAAESVKKYLFDYGDLTTTEQQLLKRIMPFYTWTSKNVPLQVQQFFENPGKFSKISVAKNDIESGVPQPNERYMSDYIAGNSPVRVATDAKGNTMYFLMGQWLPASSALQMLSQPIESAVGMVSPFAKLPYETLTNKSTFFKDTLGNYDSLSKYPGQKTSYLGMDLDPKLVNLLRSFRTLNDLDKLNPGGMFGDKNYPSVLSGIVDYASTQRGGKYTPETNQRNRALNYIVGKLNSYNPKDAKYFYDRDTQSQISAYNADINRAKKNHQTDLVKKLVNEMNIFKLQRSGKLSDKALEEEIKKMSQNLNPFYNQ